MENFIKKKSKLSDKEINELLYYYQQGIEIGKEEATFEIINKLIKLNININDIAKATNISINNIKEFFI